MCRRPSSQHFHVPPPVTAGNTSLCAPGLGIPRGKLLSYCLLNTRLDFKFTYTSFFMSDSPEYLFNLATGHCTSVRVRYKTVPSRCMERLRLGKRLKTWGWGWLSNLIDPVSLSNIPRPPFFTLLQRSSWLSSNSYYVLYFSRYFSPLLLQLGVRDTTFILHLDFMIFSALFFKTNIK